MYSKLEKLIWLMGLGSGGQLYFSTYVDLFGESLKAIYLSSLFKGPGMTVEITEFRNYLRPGGAIWRAPPPSLN